MIVFRWLGSTLNVTESWEEAERKLEELMNSEKPSMIVTLNAEMTALASQLPELREAVLSADLIVPDSIGLCWAISRKVKRRLVRIPGVELAEKLITKYGERGVFLLGAEPEVVRELPEKLESRYGASVKGYRDGYFSQSEERAVVRAIASSGAEVLLVAMGTPKQELFIRKYLSELGVKIAIGIGGTFDVWGGKVRRAPEIWRRLGLEWLYRFISQPSRLRRLPRLLSFLLNSHKWITSAEEGYDEVRERVQGL